MEGDLDCSLYLLGHGIYSVDACLIPFLPSCRWTACVLPSVVERIRTSTSFDAYGNINSQYGSGWCFCDSIQMVRYHQKKYPSYIPLHLEEVAGHFDVRRVFPTLPYSLHTEYSYGKRTFQSELIQKIS